MSANVVGDNIVVIFLFVFVVRFRHLLLLGWLLSHVWLLRHVRKVGGAGCEFRSEGFGREVTVEVDGLESLKHRGRSSKWGVLILDGLILMSVCLRFREMGVMGVLGSVRGRVEVEGFESLQHGRGSREVVVWKVMGLLMRVLVMVVVFVGVG